VPAKTLNLVVVKLRFSDGCVILVDQEIKLDLVTVHLAVEIHDAALRAAQTHAAQDM
jgi:hypothetical protein